jgi:anti-sigma factor (TIGR02949 family)
VSDKCPGIPEDCDHARRVLEDAMNGFVIAPKLIELRTEIGHCAPCVHTFDLEIRFRATMSERCAEQAPAELRIRVTEALSRVDLGKVNITDL